MAEEAAYPKYVAEFVGTFLLVFTVGCNVLCGNPVWAATSIACILMVSIYALGGVSGGNFNPSVSVALGISNKLPWNMVAAYVGIQIVAGLCAGACYGLLFWKAFNLAPGAGFGWWEAGLAEILYTCMLCFVVLNAVTTQNDGNDFFGLAIGFVIVAGGYAAGGISGGCFNPAVALGIDISSAGLGVGWGFVYCGYEILGSMIAAGLYRLVRPDEFGGDTDYSLGTRLVSEFIGTFYLVLTVGLNVLGKSPAPAFSIAAALMSMIYALGSCSGANFNPAVTLAIVLSGRGKLKAFDGAMYVLIQILAGITAAYVYAGMHHGQTFPLQPGKGYTWAGAFLAEVVFTFTLCYVVLSVATIKGGPYSNIFGLAIASCVTAGGYAIGAVSGGSLNPAVSFGISAANIINHGMVVNCLIYSLFECLGGVLAAGLFRVTHPSEYAKGAFLKK